MFYSFVETIGKFVTSEWFILSVILLIERLCMTGFADKLMKMPFKKRVKLVGITVFVSTSLVILIEVLSKAKFSWKQLMYMIALDYIDPLGVIIGLIIFDIIITLVILIAITFLAEFWERILNFAKEFVDEFESSQNNDEAELEDCSTDESEEREE